MSDRSLQVADLTLHADRGLLVCAGREWQVEPVVSSLIEVLIENLNRPCSREMLIQSVWGARGASDESLTRAVYMARRAIKLLGIEGLTIRTVPRRGYCAETSIAASKSATAFMPSELSPVANDYRPSLAVRPLKHTRSDPDLIALSHAAPYELRRQLASLRWLRVISFLSTARPITNLHAEPENYDYAVQGIIDHSQDGAMFLALELTDKSGELIWSGGFDFNYSTFVSNRAKVVAEMVYAIGSTITRREGALAHAGMPNKSQSWKLLHRALSQYNKFERAPNRTAIDYLKSAIELEPSFARAYACLSSAHFQNHFMGYSSANDEELSLTEKYAIKAVALDPLEPTANFALGRAKWLSGDLQAAAIQLAETNALCPSYAQSQYAFGLVSLIIDDVSGAREGATEALRLSPRDPMRHLMLGLRALVHLREQEFSDAATLSELATSSHGHHPYLLMVDTVCRQSAGKTKAARQLARKVKALLPDASSDAFLDRLEFSSPDLRACVVNGLRSAGLP